MFLCVFLSWASLSSDNFLFFLVCLLVVVSFAVCASAVSCPERLVSGILLVTETLHSAHSLIMLYFSHCRHIIAVR